MSSPNAAAPLVVSIGDPAGIGPEVILAAWQARDSEGLAPFAVMGGGDALRQAVARLGMDCPIGDCAIEQAADVFATALPVLPLEQTAPYTPGMPSDQGAHLAWQSLAQAIALVRQGRASAIATAPVSKAQIALVSPDFIGQTELLAQSCNLPNVDAVMMLAGPSLRTVPLTVHCALADVPALITEDLILHRCRIVARSLHTDYGIENPRIALAGLNPHAGENGRMGHEEIAVIGPAIVRLRSEGIDATGPHPADTLFAPHKRATYDVAVAMYHDQALVPLKTLDFDNGVNVTLGLPIIRTSPDHGTAFDIAGQGLASPQAMIAALRMAGDIAERRAHG